MDGGGRVAQSLKRSSRPRRANASAGQSRLNLGHEFFARFKRLLRRRLVTRHDGRLPRGLGIVAAMLLVIAAVAYGAIKGERVSDAIAHLKDGRDALANAAGFRVAQWSIAGRRQLTEQDVLSLAGVSDRTSLLFLDVEEARARLKASPWIAEAAVRKLYPAHLQVNIEEREPFALWQRDGKVFVIAGDGIVLAPLTDRRFATLPLVVGPGAEKKAKGIKQTYESLRFNTLDLASIFFIDFGKLLRCEATAELLKTETTLIRFRTTTINLEPLRALPAVVAARADNDRIELETNLPQRTVPALLRELESQHIAAEALELDPPTLERVFLKLTGHALRD